MIYQLRAILSGEKLITDHMRYEIARIGICAVHILLFLIFLFIKCYPLVIYNIFSIIFYTIILYVLIRKEKYTLSLISTYFEIVIHSFATCIIVGWTFGFAFYNIGLIYVAYYFCYISPEIKNKIFMPCIMGICNLAITVYMRFYTYLYPPMYADYTQFVSFAFCVLNIIITACMIMFFAALHSVEIRRKSYELHKSNAELDRLAHFDALTRLRNRHSMEEEFRSILKQPESEYCFVMGDIDDFKLFNDQYGHACGDFVLQSVSQIIQDNMEQKHIACRWGGEEILILLKANIEYAHIVTEKIRYEIEHMDISYESTPIHITMTFGISPLLPGRSFEKCIHRADACMYKGKQAGKNCVIVEKSPVQPT